MPFICLSIKHYAWLAVLLPALIVHSEEAAALGLGELSVRSSLGARFRAEVLLVESAGDPRTSSACFRLSPAANADPGIPVLAAAHLDLERRNGQSRLIITSDQIINEPVLQLDLRAGCGAEVVRSYTALIDPATPGQIAKPGMTASNSPVTGTLPAPQAAPQPYPKIWQAIEGESAASIARAVFPRQPRAQGRFVVALAAANPQLDLGPRGEAPLENGTTLAIPNTRRSRPAAPRSAVDETPPPDSASARNSPVRSAREKASEQRRSDGMTNRLHISGASDAQLSEPESLLRLSTELGAWPPRPLSESGRALLRLEYQLLNALYAQSTQQLAIAERVRSLETSFEQMRAATETATRQVETPAPPATVPLAARADTPTLAAARPSAPQSAVSSAGWLGILTMLGLIGALSWALVRRPAKPTAIGGDQPASATPATETGDTRDTFSQIGQRTRVVPTPPPAQAPLIAVDLLLDDSPTQPSGMIEYEHHDPSPSPTDTEVDERVDCSTAMELAEIMIAFGRVKGATQTLEDYLQHNPAASLAPWLKLLEICRANDMQEDFESYARQLESHFNVTSARWEDAATCFSATLIAVSDQDAPIEDLLPKLPAIRSNQGIKDELVRSWNSPQGSIYLASLLNDARDTSRAGVALAMVRELLYLSEIIEARRPKKS